MKETEINEIIENISTYRIEIPKGYKPIGIRTCNDCEYCRVVKMKIYDKNYQHLFCHKEFFYVKLDTYYLACPFVEWKKLSIWEKIKNYANKRIH